MPGPGGWQGNAFLGVSRAGCWCPYGRIPAQSRECSPGSAPRPLSERVCVLHGSSFHWAVPSIGPSGIHTDGVDRPHRAQAWLEVHWASVGDTVPTTVQVWKRSRSPASLPHPAPSCGRQHPRLLAARPLPAFPTASSGLPQGCATLFSVPQPEPARVSVLRSM